MFNSVKRKIITILVNELKIPFQEDYDLLRSEIYEWDSLKHFEIILALENEFNIRLTIEEINDMQSAKDIIRIIEKLLAE